MTLKNKDFILNTVIEPIVNLWFDEINYIKILQTEPKREVYLTRCEMDIWRLLAEEDYTVNSIIEKLQDKHEKDVVLESLGKLDEYMLISKKKNYLWKNDD